MYCLEAMKTKFNAGWQQLKGDLKKLGQIFQIEANFCYDSYRNMSRLPISMISAREAL